MIKFGEQILSLTAGSSNLKHLAEETDSLKGELSRKNIELRTKNEEVEKLRKDIALRADNLAPRISSLSAELFLEECNRERKLLQERIYELRKDIERLQNIGSSASSAELTSLRQRIEDLRTRNLQLETQLHTAEQAHMNESTHISALTAELTNCRQLLDEVLNAK